MEKRIILILGADGMVGHTVYSYLHLRFPNTIFGTARKNSKFFILNADNFKNNLKSINEIIGDIDYVINCIGILKNGDKKKMFFINSEFPQKLAQLSQKYKFRLIHVSSDAVFSSMSGKVTEQSKTSPEDEYGKGKLKGEPKSKNALSIRTSFLGFDPLEHKGLLEWVLNSNGKIQGYTNQFWSGCTTLQFAKFCEFLIESSNFDDFRKKSSFLHFAPLGPITKYEILSEFMKLSNKKKEIKKSNSDIMINRFLSSMYFDNGFIKNYTTNLRGALSELIKFEKSNK